MTPIRCRPGRRAPEVVLPTALGLGALLGVTALALAGSLLTSSPASAHASSQIPHARWSASDVTARMHLTAAADDLADAVVAAGVWDEEVMWAYVEADPELIPSAADIAALADDDDLHAYLLDHVRLTQDGSPCDATVHVGTDLITDGVHYEFACDRPLSTARIHVSLLHGQNASYRVISVDGTEQFAIHTHARPEHEWDFTLAQTGARPWALLLGGGVTLLLLAGAGVALLRRSSSA